MAAELISALLDAVAEGQSVAAIFTVDAVRQTDDPAACLRQTWRFIIAQTRRRPDTENPLDNPNIAWMHARCEACGICMFRP